MTASPVSSEAEIVALLAPLAASAPGAFGLVDDCAVLTPRAGQDLVLKTDPVRAGVHFFPDTAPADIAWKALAVGVSDLAAKGARPLAYLMALSFPEAPARAWVDQFAQGLADAQAAFGCHLIGGDTDRAPGPLSIAITVIGEVPVGTMVRRATARPGDVLYVSATLGDAALGLRLLDERRHGSDALAAAWGLAHADTQSLIARHLRPLPRLALGAALRAHANAAMDLSDGLLKDLGRMCAAAGVGAIVEAAALPLSGPARTAIGRTPELFAAIVAAGDDYEILAAVPGARTSSFEAAARAAATAVARIGTVVEGAGARLLDAHGREMAFASPGWEHFD